jgi:hypothetical protein
MREKQGQMISPNLSFINLKTLSSSLLEREMMGV